MKNILVFNKYRGSTIVELIISSLITAFVVMAISSVLMGFIKLNKLNQDISIANDLAKVQIEALRNNASNIAAGIVEKSPTDIDETIDDQKDTKEINNRMRFFVSSSDISQVSTDGSFSFPLKQVVVRAYSGYILSGQFKKTRLLTQFSTIIKGDLKE